MRKNIIPAVLLLCLSLTIPAAEPNFDRMELWRKNSTQGSTMAISRDTEEKAIRFDVKFQPETDFWAYPEFKLPEGIPAGKKYLVFEAKLTQQNPAAGYKTACVMFGYKGGTVRWTPSPRWQQVVIDLDARKIDRDAVKCLRIGANPKSPGMTLLLRNVKLLEQLPKEESRNAADLIRSNAPAMLFPDGAPIGFTVTERFPGLAYEILNRHDQVVANGTVPTDGRVSLASLPRGYYRIALQAPDMQFKGTGSFSVIPDPARRKANLASPYCMDAALSVIGSVHTYRRGEREKGIRFFVELARLAGVTFARERTHQDRAEPTEGQYDWSWYKTAPELFFEAGIGVSSTWHSFAPWARVKGHKYPRDLRTAYRFARKLAETFPGKIRVWEFWNEPDLSGGGFWDGSAWDFASMSKAAYLGFKAGDSSIPVTNGSFCVAPETDLFAREALQNDLVEYFDIFNFHTYSPLKEYPAQVGGWKKLLQEYGVGDMPIWVTENGTRAEGVAKVAPRRGKNHVHSHEQEMIWAEFIPKSQLLLQSLGVARDFSFVLPPMNEQQGKKNWGLIRYDYTAKPGFTAFATLTDQLGNAEYLGQPDFGPGIRAFLFRQPDGRQTLAFWSESELDQWGTSPAGIQSGNEFQRKFTLSSDRPLLLADIFGTPEQVKPQNGTITITATRYPAYLSGITTPIPVKTPPVRIGRPGARRSEIDKSIVLRIVPDDKFLLNGNRTVLIVPSNATKRPLKLQVINFSDEKKQGQVTVEGGRLSGLPAPVELAPFETREISLSLPEKSSAGRSRFHFAGSFNGRPISRLSLPVIQLAEVADTPLLVGAEKPENWRKNSSGKMTISRDEAEQAIRFDVEFPPDVDRWVYPEFLIPGGGLPADTIGISFEIKSDSKEKPINNLVMLVKDRQKETGRSHNISYAPSLGEWRQVFVETASLSPETIQQIRIGMNPTIDKVTYRIRNIRLHRTGL